MGSIAALSGGVTRGAAAKETEEESKRDPDLAEAERRETETVTSDERHGTKTKSARGYERGEREREAERERGRERREERGERKSMRKRKGRKKAEKGERVLGGEGKSQWRASRGARGVRCPLSLYTLTLALTRARKGNPRKKIWGNTPKAKCDVHRIDVNAINRAKKRLSLFIAF